MKTHVSFAHTATLFPYPVGLTALQYSLFDKLVDWLNEKCFENENWDGREIFLPDVSDIPDIETVFLKIQPLCQFAGGDLYWSRTGEKTWTVATVESKVASQPA